MLPKRLIELFDYLELRKEFWKIVDIMAVQYLGNNFASSETSRINDYRREQKARLARKSRAKPMLFPRVEMDVARTYLDFMCNLPKLGLWRLDKTIKHSIVWERIAFLQRPIGSHMPLTGEETQLLVKLLDKLAFR